MLRTGCLLQAVRFLAGVAEGVGMRLRHAFSIIALVAGVFPALAVAAHAAAPAAATLERHTARPNVLIWVMDDVGFAQLSGFGGLVPTPNIDRIARTGLRYVNYHTPPLCSAARASLLTGRNSHSVHVGGHAALARDHPGYDGRIPPGAGTIAENLRQAGYATFALGKWDHAPLDESTPAGPFTYWPLRQGFDRFYGFLAAETDNFEPLLWNDDAPVNRPPGENYHLSTDLADHAIAMLDSRGPAERAAPFFMYWATGVAHAPHHAPADWIARFRGKFDPGWDKARELILDNQKAQGLVPKHAALAPRPERMPPWDSLRPEEKRLHARQMEVFAAALSHADAQFGRILDALVRRGELENTIVVVLSDNGASAEGGPTGSYHELLFALGALPSVEQNLAFLDRWGVPGTYPHYALGWAVAGNTPFRNYKQTTYEGGTRVPLVVAWPNGIRARGEVRGQFVHASDITPTLLSMTGVKPVATVNDVPQRPFEGRDFSYSFTDAARTPQRSQYFEMFGHKGLWSDGWKIVSYSKLETWNMTGPGRIDRPWELYDLDRDPMETSNLAESNPARLAELEREFDAQARQFNVYPLADPAGLAGESRLKMAAQFARRQGTWSYPFPVARLVGAHAPPLARGNFTMRARVTLRDGTESGAIFAHGGRMGGVGLYLDRGRPVFVVRSMAGEPRLFAADEGLAPGSNQIELRLAPADLPGGRRNVVLMSGGRMLLSRSGVFDIPPGPGETFEVGRDDGTAVGEGYAPGAAFPGEIRDVSFTFH